MEKDLFKFFCEKIKIWPYKSVSYATDEFDQVCVIIVIWVVYVLIWNVVKWTILTSQFCLLQF